MSANENHYKRDAIISQRHRSWGLDCPAMDVDFMLIEYDRLKAVAIIDYKHENSTINTNSAGARVMANLADRAGIIACIVVYGHSEYDKNGLWAAPTENSDMWFNVIPLNAEAIERQPRKQKLTEVEYVSWLYDTRGRVIPAKLAWQLGQ
jgi:hypothetical protein